jgi:hypothetical protein
MMKFTTTILVLLCVVASNAGNDEDNKEVDGSVR